MLLEGMYLPLTTPFSSDGRLNLRKLHQNVTRYSLTPASGMVVLGQTGEANLLTDAESEEVLGVAIKAAAPTKVMLAGVSCDGVLATVERTEMAAALGYDAVIVRASSFAGATAQQQRVYVESVADRSPLPLVLAGELVAELAFHPQIIGCVWDGTAGDSLRTLLQRTATIQRTATVTTVFAAVTGRVLAAQPVEQQGTIVSAASLTGGTALAIAPAKVALKTRTKSVGFQVLMGSTAQMLPGWLAGATGAVPPLAAAAPQACHEVWAAWKDGDPALADEKQQRLLEAVRWVEETLGVAGLKYGCDLNGYFGGSPRLPLLPLLGEQKAELERLMQGLRS